MKLKGYMSVEAALVFPVVIMVVMIMMGMSFYVYDRCVIRACVCDGLLYGASEELQENSDKEKLFQDKLEKDISQNGLSLSDVKVESEIGMMQVKATVDAKVNLLWITSTQLPIHVEDKLTKFDIVKVKRLMKIHN